MPKVIELPCNIGDTIYIVSKNRGIISTKVRVFWIGQIGQGCDVLMVRTEDYDVPASNFGKTAFFTREKAENAIKTAGFAVRG